MAAKVYALLHGRDAQEAEVRAWAASADRLYGADGAGALLCRLGFGPTVVGDLDSALPEQLARAERVVLDPSQDTTDCDKLLAQIERDGHSAATLAGVEGDRLDHLLASLGSVARSRLGLRLLLRTGVGWTVRPGQPAAAGLAPGTAVSLLPLVDCADLRLEGVRWPLVSGAATLAAGLSVSNVASGPVSASVGSGAALLVAVLGGAPPPEW